MNRRLGGDLPRTHSFRLASLVAILVPYAASWLAPGATLADTVGMAFAIAASTLGPLLILGVWWRRLSVTGAAAGLIVGGTLAMGATVATLFGVGRGTGGWSGAARPTGRLVDADRLHARRSVSLATPRSVPVNAPLARWSACTPPKK
jgi:cation/acetate symporter